MTKQNVPFLFCMNSKGCGVSSLGGEQIKALKKMRSKPVHQRRKRFFCAALKNPLFKGPPPHVLGFGTGLPLQMDKQEHSCYVSGARSAVLPANWPAQPGLVQRADSSQLRCERKERRVVIHRLSF